MMVLRGLEQSEPPGSFSIVFAEHERMSCNGARKERRYETSVYFSIALLLHMKTPNTRISESHFQDKSKIKQADLCIRQGIYACGVEYLGSVRSRRMVFDGYRADTTLAEFG
jgi:hypothetical protein